MSDDPISVVQVWYCTSSRSHTTISKYAEYLATSYKEAKEKLGNEFSVNPKVRDDKDQEDNQISIAIHSPPPQKKGGETLQNPVFDYLL